MFLIIMLHQKEYLLNLNNATDVDYFVDVQIFNLLFKPCCLNCDLFLLDYVSFIDLKLGASTF